MVANIHWIWSALNFLVNAFLTFFCRPQIYEVCHIWEWFISSVYVVFLFCNLMKGHEHFSQFTSNPTSSQACNRTLCFSLWKEIALCLQNMTFVWLGILITLTLISEIFSNSALLTHMYKQTNYYKKVVPLHAMKVSRGRGGIAPTHS
jgi:hypothetical protein